MLKNKLQIEIMPIYSSYKFGHYFQLKSQIPLSLRGDVVNQFDCLQNVNVIYISIIIFSGHLCTIGKGSGVRRIFERGGQEI